MAEWRDQEVSVLRSVCTQEREHTSQVFGYTQNMNVTIKKTFVEFRMLLVVEVRLSFRYARFK